MSKLDWYLRENLKIRHLQLTIALDDMRNLSKVATYFNISQPAISKTLSLLESGLGVKLFDRSSQGIVPTEQGECFLRYARQIIKQMASASNEIQDITEGRFVRIRIGIIPSAAFLVSRFVDDLENELSEVTISVYEAATLYLLRMLRAGDINIAVVNLPLTPLGAEFKSKLLFEDQLMVVARNGHPLSEAKNPSWEMLSDYPMVLPTPTAVTRSTLEANLLRKGVNISRRSVESLSTMTNIGIIQDTDSIGFLGKNLADQFLQRGFLSTLPLKLDNVCMRIGLVWLADRKLTKSQEKVRRLFIKAVEKNHFN